MGMDYLGAMCDELCNNSCFDVCEAGNGREIQVHKVNRRLMIFLGIVIEGFTIPENSVHKIIFCEIMCLVE